MGLLGGRRSLCSGTDRVWNRHGALPAPVLAQGLDLLLEQDELNYHPSMVVGEEELEVGGLEVERAGMGEVEEQDGEDGDAGHTCDVDMLVVRLVLGGSGSAVLGFRAEQPLVKHGGVCLEASSDNAVYEKDVEGNAWDAHAVWYEGRLGAGRVWASKS